MTVRLDKWLQVARLFKTRSQAATACNRGRVSVNGRPSKPHRHLRLGDRIEIEVGDRTRILVLQELRDKPMPKAEVSRLYTDMSPPQPEVDPLDRFLRQPTALRQPGDGRPTKRQRRQIDRWRSR